MFCFNTNSFRKAEAQQREAAEEIELSKAMKLFKGACQFIAIL